MRSNFGRRVLTALPIVIALLVPVAETLRPDDGSAAAPPPVTLSTRPVAETDAAVSEDEADLDPLIFEPQAEQ